MKIGLITHHWVPNFGANLQVLATTNYIKSLGHTVFNIDYKPDELVKLTKHRIHPNQYEIHELFANENLNLTDSYGSAAELEKHINKYDLDVVLSGSDALFRLDHFQDREDLNFPNPFWLDWTLKKKLNIKLKGFVSVSNMGSDYDKLTDEVQGKISDLLQEFQFVSVRDNWTKKSLLKLNPLINTVVNVDPVFMLNEYLEIPDKYTIETKEKYILLSPYENMLDNRWIDSFVKKSHRHGYLVYSLPHPEGHVIKNKIIDKVLDFPMHPLKWYSYIINSSGYIGVRFHPIITALSNGIPFVSLDTYQKSIWNPTISKTYDICKKTGMEKYCLGKIKRKLYSANVIFNLLQEQIGTNKVQMYQKFVHEETAKLKKVVLDIIGSVD